MLTPRNYQNEAILRSACESGLILADECGLGKTLVAIEVFKAIREPISTSRALVVCPPSLIPQWEQFIMDQDPHQPITRSLYIPYDFQKLTGWVLSSYFELHNDMMFKRFTALLWDFVVLDEAHRIKNRTTITSKRARKIPHIIGMPLTGTPFEQLSPDIWALLNFVRPDKFPTFWGFAYKNFNIEKGFWAERVIEGPKDHKKFAAVLDEHMLRRLKKDVAPELPPKIETDAKVEMTEAQLQCYKDFKTSDDIIVVSQDNEYIVPNVLALITRLQQIAS